MARLGRRTLDESAHKQTAAPEVPPPREPDGAARPGSRHEPAQGGETTAEPSASRGAQARAETPTPSGRRNLNEAAHKLGYWPEKQAPAERPRPSAALEAAADEQRDVIADAGKAALALAALGVVYGDIGTSPLYTEQFIFTAHRAAAKPTVAGAYGIASLIFWTLVIEVSIKYAGFIMRAHNRGDGGIMALTALVQRKRIGRTALLVTLGIFGAGLFFGDGMITPAISVTSAVSGLSVISQGLAHLVVPLSMVILVGLFAVQRLGTGGVGRLFGPIMAVFFLAIAVLGLGQILAHPGVLEGLSPSYGAQFMADHGVKAWLTLGGVVLCTTGAEAMYADRGHFGATPIRMTWFGVVFPAVILSYLGQAAFILHHPQLLATPQARSTFNPFFQLIPHGLLVPMVVLATAATVIASQAAITGSFSVAKQAVQLGLLPRLRIIHTSLVEGQIYVPIINWFLGIGVVVLVLVFRSSNRLGDIYGVAVTATFILNTILFLAVARGMWRTPRWRLAILGTLFLCVEVAFFSSNMAKITDGAYLSLLVGLAIAGIMATWRRGREIVTRNRTSEEGQLDGFIDGLCRSDPPVVRVPGVGIFLTPNKTTTPLALRALVERAHIFFERVVLVSIDWVSIPHVEEGDRFDVERLGRGLFKIVHVTIRIGYRDRFHIPEALALARKRGLLDRNLDLEHASFFLSRINIVPTDDPGMARWRKHLFVTMARNSTSPVEHFGLPTQRTVMSGSQVPV